MTRFRKIAISLPVALLVAMVVPGRAVAQDQRTSEIGSFGMKSAVAEFLATDGILSNSVSNIVINGDSVWIGPYLNMTADDGMSWFRADTEQLYGTRNRVFSLDVDGDVIWVGLGYNDLDNDGIQSAGGFLLSVDGGETFTFREAQLDAPGDTTVVYGASTLYALDVIVPQQSPPYDIDFDPGTGTVYMAGWASGLRKSTDAGVHWERVVLPPDDLEAISIDSLYDFRVEPRRGNTGNFNHMGFAVHLASDGTIWAGTPLGINKSTDDGLSWKRTSADGSASSLTGNWVVAIGEQSTASGSAIWLATWSALETGDLGGRSGVSVTRDGGETYEQVLVGERFVDFAFAGNRAYVAGRESGLFVSDDGGKTWETIRDFDLESTDDRRIRVGSDVLSVATSEDAVWVGTSDGLLRSTDGGSTWKTFRVEVPLHPEDETEEVPSVDTFAYPNPFSPIADGFVRLRYEMNTAGNVDVRIYDFRMNELRRLPAESKGTGPQETTWDGANGNGVRLSNGTYFYSVDTGGGKYWGKILVVE